MRWIVVGPSSLDPAEHGGDGVALLGDALDGGRGAVEPLEHPGLDLGGHVRVERAGAERRGELAVHRAHRLADAVGLAGEVAADLVGAQVGLGEQVAHAGQGHRPAVGRVRRVLLQHRDGHGLAVERALDRPEQGRHLGAALAAQRPVQLEVRVEPGGRAAEELEDGALAVDHRAVRLLALQRAPGAHDHRLGVGLGDEAQGLAGRVVGDELQEQPADPPVGEAVVDHVVAAPADHGVLEVAGRLVLRPEDQLVALLGGPVGERHGDHRVLHGRRLTGLRDH